MKSTLIRLPVRLPAIFVLGLLAGCKVAANQPDAAIPNAPKGEEPKVVLVPLTPGAQKPVAEESVEGRRLMNDPQAIAAGKQLFNAMNCVGCHFNGGGGIGPPLMDQTWIYGGSIENIAATIREGRPNGMPSFRGFLPEEQIWQLAAYVRSLSHPDAGGKAAENGQ